jgi:hypothetical protein
MMMMIMVGGGGGGGGCARQSRSIRRTLSVSGLLRFTGYVQKDNKLENISFGKLPFQIQI